MLFLDVRTDLGDDVTFETLFLGSFFDGETFFDTVTPIFLPFVAVYIKIESFLIKLTFKFVIITFIDLKTIGMSLLILPWSVN